MTDQGRVAQTGIFNVDQHDLSVLEHDVAWMEILMDERVPVRDLVDDLVKFIGFLLCVETCIERRLDIGSGSVSRIRERARLKLRAVEVLQSIGDHVGIIFDLLRMRNDLFIQRLRIYHLKDDPVIITDLNHIKSDRRRHAVYECFLRDLPVLVDLLRRVAVAEIYFDDGLGIKPVNDAVTSSAEHLAPFDGYLTHRLLCFGFSRHRTHIHTSYLPCLEFGLIVILC